MEINEEESPLLKAQQLTTLLNGDRRRLIHVANPGSKEDEEQNDQYDGSWISPSIRVSRWFNLCHAIAPYWDIQLCAARETNRCKKLLCMAERRRSSSGHTMASSVVAGN